MTVLSNSGIPGTGAIAGTSFSPRRTSIEKYTWKEKTATARTIADLFDLASLPPGSHDQLKQELFASSFFLPAEILNDKRFAISPIYVFPGGQLVSALRDIPKAAATYCDVSTALLQYAINVGVSIRIDTQTKKCYLVFKLWHGKNPWLGKTREMLACIKQDRVIRMAHQLLADSESTADSTGQSQ